MSWDEKAQNEDDDKAWAGFLQLIAADTLMRYVPVGSWLFLVALLTSFFRLQAELEWMLWVICPILLLLLTLISVSISKKAGVWPSMTSGVWTTPFPEASPPLSGRS